MGNGPSTDSVAHRLTRAGFRNVWEEIHGRPCGVTHVDHRGHNFASDHVWVRGSVAPCGATLLPEGVPDDRLLRRPTLGGAAAILQRDVRKEEVDLTPKMEREFEEWC